MSEKITLVVTPRDRFSCTETCINNLLKTVPEPYDLIVVLGGCPIELRDRLMRQFTPKARFILRDHFLNTAQARNLALREIETRRVLFLDNDVYVRPGWFEPLLRCQDETGAAMVGPVILDRQNLIHTAGNSLYVTRAQGRDYALMEIRYANQPVGQTTNIPRQPSDFLEIHCQLVLTSVAKELPLYDEALRENHELNAGLVLSRAGQTMVVEPASLVYLYYPDRLEHAEDVRFFCWKWDMKAIHEGFDYFKKKWGYDLDYRGISHDYFTHVNRRCNFFARLWPAPFTLRLDQWKHRAYHALRRSG